jgi:hypothetical protein
MDSRLTEKLVPLIIVRRNKAGETVSVEIIERGYIAVWVEDKRGAAERLRRDAWALVRAGEGAA